MGETDLDKLHKVHVYPNRNSTTCNQISWNCFVFNKIFFINFQDKYHSQWHCGNATYLPFLHSQRSVGRPCSWVWRRGGAGCRLAWNLGHGLANVQHGLRHTVWWTEQCVQSPPPIIPLCCFFCHQISVFAHPVHFAWSDLAEPSACWDWF